MKKIAIFIIIILCTNAQHLFGQACCSIFNKSKKIKKPAIYIYFDEKGIPTDTAEQYIPYGTQVNLIATKINPLEQLPEVKTFFKDYYVAPSDIPDISKLLAPAATSSPTQEKEKASQTIQVLRKNLEQKEMAYIKLGERISGAKNKAAFLGASNLYDSTKNSTDPIKTNELLVALEKRNRLLEVQISDNKQLLADLKEVNGELVKAIILLKKVEETAPLIRNDYNSFTRILDSINYLLTLQPAVNKLFSQQFIDPWFTQKSIEQLVKVRLPKFADSLDNSITAQGDFLRGSIDNLEKLYSNLTENIKKINENIATDSFGTNKTTEIELLNKDKKKVKVKIGSISIEVNKEPLFKDQFDFVTKQITRFRNEKFRDSLYVFTDTVLIQTLKLYHNKFEQTIKSFKANADEIKINLPYKNSEPYIIKTRCRFKVEGSTGIFTHLFGSDDKFKVVQAAQLDGSDSLQVIRQRKDNMILSLGFMANVYIYDPSKLFNPGFSVGLNFPVINHSGTGGIAQLVAGVSFFSTTVDKLSLTFGVSLRRGQVLNTNNLTSIDGVEKYVFNNKNTLEPTFDQVTKVGGFFGISYSLFGGKKSSQAE